VGLLTPSGIAADATAAPFFREIATTGRLAALFDYENKKSARTSLLPDPTIVTRFHRKIIKID
jgi:hypothetical protein